MEKTQTQTQKRNEFRITAENEMGKSEPLVTDPPIKAESARQSQNKNEWPELSDGGWGNFCFF